MAVDLSQTVWAYLKHRWCILDVWLLYMWGWNQTGRISLELDIQNFKTVRWCRSFSATSFNIFNCSDLFWNFSFWISQWFCCLNPKTFRARAFCTENPEVFGSFLPALTAGRRKGTVAAESSEEEKLWRHTSQIQTQDAILIYIYIICIYYVYIYIYLNLAQFCTWHERFIWRRQETSSSASFVSAEAQHKPWLQRCHDEFPLPSWIESLVGRWNSWSATGWAGLKIVMW